jgi:hypothetical protein
LKGLRNNSFNLRWMKGGKGSRISQRERMYCPFIGIILILYFLARLSYFGYMRHKYILYVFIYLHKIYLLCVVGDILVYFVAEENWMLIGGIRNGRWTVAVDLLLPMDEVGAIKYNFTAKI